MLQMIGYRKLNIWGKKNKWWSKNKTMKKNEGLDGRVEDGKAEKGKKGKTISLS